MKKGFTLFEVLVVIAVVAVLVTFSLTYLPRLFSHESKQLTLENLEMIKKGMVGDPAQVENRVRISYGYLGDMGRLPSSLMDLLVQGAQPGYAYDQSKKAGAGWRGPYLRLPQGQAGQFNPDPYGSAYIYHQTQYASPDTGGLVLANVVSPGADLAANSTDDLRIEVFQTEVHSQITGAVKDRSYTYVPNVKVEINYPSNGTLTSQQVVTDAQGRYVFSNIPFGPRSLTVEPQLVYETGTALTSTQGANLQFQATNYSPNAVTVTSLKATYAASPAAYYEQVVVNGTTQWDYRNYGNVRAGSGQVVSFSSAVTAAGTNVSNLSISVSLQAPRVELTDIIIGTVFRGQTLTIQINGFKDASGSGGSPVDVTAVPFQVTFSDGSVASFVPGY